VATEAVDEIAQEDSESASSGRKFSLNGKAIKVGGLLALVMAAQVAIGFFLLPSPAATDPGDPANSAALAEEDTTVDQADLVEVEIGTFNSTNSNAVKGSDIHVSLSVAATVSSKAQQSFQDAIKTDHPARVRQAVERVVRSSTIDDLNDPDFDVIKRKIREDVNKVVDGDYIVEVIISDYKTMHQ